MRVFSPRRKMFTLAATLRVLIVMTLAATAAHAGEMTAAGPSSRSNACSSELLEDWQDGWISASYPRACYEAAIVRLHAAERSPAADELQAELANAPGRASLGSERGRRGGPRDVCPTLDQVAPCPGAIARFARHPHLTLRGALNATSSRSLYESGYNSCGYRAARDELIVEAAPIRLRGSEVARVGFTLLGYHGPGSYSARLPRVAYGRTPVQITLSERAATGVATAFFVARSGRVRITYADRVGRRGRYAFVAGTVSARLVDPQTRASVSLTGSWVCSAEPVANGPS